MKIYNFKVYFNNENTSYTQVASSYTKAAILATAHRITSNRDISITRIEVYDESIGEYRTVEDAVKGGYAILTLI